MERLRCPRFLLPAVFLFLFPAASACAQEPQRVERDSTFWIFQRKPLVTYTIAAYSAYVLYKEWKWWWRDNSSPFEIRSEGFLNNYSLGVDKVGHFYTSYLYVTSFRELMEWGGFEPETALWFSLGIASFHAISIEIGDGFSTYHFAPDDLLAIPTADDTWDMLKRVLNPFHFPAPGVKFINGEPAQFKPILLF